MENADLFSVGSTSLSGLSRSTLWKNTDRDVFSTSTREEEENDLEALEWAALERLPTFSRLRTGILTEVGGVRTEVDVRKLGPAQKKVLLETLLRVAEEDRQSFLTKLKDRIDRVGIRLPTIEVRFHNLSVDAEAYAGSKALPTVFNFSVNVIKGLFNSLRILSSKRKSLSILKDVSGIIKPCRLTLLLGPPRSGKTTLLLALSGKLGSDLKHSGMVTYNGHEMHEFVPQRTSAYISQYDVHTPQLTVRETLAFSARCQGVGARYDLLAELTRREKEANIFPDLNLDIVMKAAAMEGEKATLMTDYILRILGLEVCADTLVGNETLGGISADQRKLVTVGEMMVGPTKALFMDEISTGLDSSTTFQIVDHIRKYIHILEGTAVVSLLQPAPETYDLFDDIILLSDGLIVYHGPRENVLEFFEHMGFRCPERKAVADFLQEVISQKDQYQYWARKDEPYHFVTSREFAESFHSFHVGQELYRELSVSFDKARSHPAALVANQYGVSKKELLIACISRELLLMRRNSFVYIFKTVQIALMSILTGTIFLKTEFPRTSVQNGVIVLGALFFGVSVLMFNGLSELSQTIMRLPVFYKHRGHLFFPPWAYSLPLLILNTPIAVVQVIIWVSVTYFLIGYDLDVQRFFRQIVILTCIKQMASGLFRFVAAIGRNMLIANIFGTFAFIGTFVLGGFVLSRDQIKKWLSWGYWISPMMYGQNAISVNEFLGKSWSGVSPNSSVSLGVIVLKSRAIFPEAHWYWIGVGALIGYILLFNSLFTLALTYLNPLDTPQAILCEDTTDETNVDITGEESKVGKVKLSTSPSVDDMNEAHETRKRE